MKNFLESVKELFLRWCCYCSCCCEKEYEDQAESRIPNHPNSHQKFPLTTTKTYSSFKERNIAEPNQFSNFSYFNQSLSLDAIRRVDTENKKFANGLKKQGHGCVYVYETIPTRVGWCQKEKCIGPNYFD